MAKNFWENDEFAEWGNDEVVGTEQPVATPQSYMQKRFPFATQGIQQAKQGNPIAGGFNLANQFFSEAGRPFQQADEALRQVPVIGEPLSNILRFPPYLAGKAVETGTNLISATGIPQMLNRLLPLDESGETAQALGTTNQMISPFVVIPPMAKGVAKIPQTAAKASQGIANALSQSAYKIPPSIKSGERAQLLQTAQKENIVPTKKGIERLDAKVGELKKTAEALEQKAMATNNKSVPVEEIVSSIYDLSQKWSKSDTPKEFIGILENYKQKVLTQQKPELSIQDMIDLKRNLQKQLSDVYVKQMKINPSMRENVLREAKSSIENSVREKLEDLIPDYKNTNSQIHKLLNLKPYVEQAANRISNQDLTTIRLKDVLLGGGVAGAGGDPISIAASIVIGRVLTDQRVQAYLGNKLSTESFFRPQSTRIDIKKFPVNPKTKSSPPTSKYEDEANNLGIKFNGYQNIRSGKPIPIFTDSKTGTTFAKGENETLMQALQRKRMQFGY